MDDKDVKLTFWTKKPLTCPVCQAEFKKEEILTGRGRLIAGNLTNELRREYEPSLKYGEVYPLIYTITLCPVCLYGALPSDFPELPQSSGTAIEMDTANRQDVIKGVFNEPDFNLNRDLVSGTASYVMAVMSYEFRPPEESPTIKAGLCALRAAWLCNDLHNKEPNENFDYLASMMYRKAKFYYTQAIDREQTGKEGLGALIHMGPDLDKNWGYDGALYLAAMLEFEHGSNENSATRIKALNNAKKTVSRVFGSGKSSKNKPEAILDFSRELYERINDEVKVLEG